VKPIYQINGLVPADYLPGQYRWPAAMRLAAVLVTVHARPADGPLVLELEVNGALTGVQVAVAAGSGAFHFTQELNQPVPANEWARWRVMSGGGDAANLSLTLTVARAAIIKPPLTLRWFRADEQLTLYDYDPVTHER